jgi:hypothetical protein
MKKQTTILMGLGAFALAQAAPAALDGLVGGTAVLVPIAHAEGGEGGEAGGKAAGGDEAPDFATDDVAYLTQLGLIEGKLWVGAETYRAGDPKAALPHVTDADHELYEPLEPALKARKVAAFDADLDALADAISGGKPATELDASYKRIDADLAAARGAVKPTSGTTLLVAAHLMHEAAEDYDNGVKDGRLVDAHEYRDSLGYAHSAEAMVGALPGEGKGGAADAVREARATLDALKPAWPGVKPPDSLSFDSSKLHGAAAKLEFLAQKAK